MVKDHASGARLHLPSCDVLVLHRIPVDRDLLAHCKRIQERGGVVLADLDDLVFDASEVRRFARALGEPLVRRIGFWRDALAIREGILNADLTLVSTQALADELTGVCTRVQTYRNSYSTEMQQLSDHAWRSRRVTDNRVVIGYASGTPTHALDFRTILPVIERTLDRNPSAHLRVLGHLQVPAELCRFGPRVEHRGFVPWRSLPAELSEFDINIVPLEGDRHFCRAKSEVKFLEASLVRVPTIASAIPAYASAMTSGMDGVTARSLEDWTEGLEFLVRNRELRRAMGMAAFETVRQEYSPERRTAELRGLLAGYFGERVVGHSEAGRMGGTVSSAGVGLLVVADRCGAIPARSSMLGKAYHFLRFESYLSVAARFLVSLLVRYERMIRGFRRFLHG